MQVYRASKVCKYSAQLQYIRVQRVIHSASLYCRSNFLYLEVGHHATGMFSSWDNDELEQAPRRPQLGSKPGRNLQDAFGVFERILLMRVALIYFSRMHHPKALLNFKLKKKGRV